MSEGSGQGYQGAPPAPPTAGGSGAGEPTSDEKTMALFCHLLGLLTWVIGPLIIWLMKKDTSAFVDDQGKEALNFQITLTIYYAIAGLLTVILIGTFLLPLVGLFGLVFAIIATVAASKGERYRYPMTIRLIN